MIVICYCARGGVCCPPPARARAVASRHACGRSVRAVLPSRLVCAARESPVRGARGLAWSPSWQVGVQMDAAYELDGHTLGGVGEDYGSLGLPLWTPTVAAESTKSGLRTGSGFAWHPEDPKFGSVFP